MNKRQHAYRYGFALIELAVSLLVMTILAGIIVPNYVNGLQQEAAKKTALEMVQIQEAARKFYIDNNAWPASISALQSSGYLDQAWAANNPFSSQYLCASSTMYFTVSTVVPGNLAGVLTNNLQMPSSQTIGSLATVVSSVPVPGAVVPGVPVGTIIPWSATTAPVGWLLCAGQAVSRTTYLALFLALGTTYGAGNGSTTFNVPDLRGRAVVGLDNMANTPAGVITGSWGSTPGGKFGAEKHLLSGAESGLPAHTHTIYAMRWPGGGAGGNGTSGGNYTLTTSTAGPSDATSAHNNIQPSIALAYIIKY